MKINVNTKTARSALTGVALLGLTLSLSACGGSSGSGSDSSKQFTEPAEAASYWLSAVQSGDFSKACEVMSPGAVRDLIGNTGAEDCGAALQEGLSWYGDMEDYNELFTHGAPTGVDADQCGDLEVGKTCWADFLWEETSTSPKFSVDKLLVRSPEGFQVSMLANEGETGYGPATDEEGDL